MKSFKILLNNRFTGDTSTINSSLEFDGGYLVYLNRNGGGLVNPFNVRGYLNDARNQQVINDFFGYLTANTTQSETVNIVSSDQKLSDVFNSYYQNYILSSSAISNTSVIDENLTGTNTYSHIDYFHLWNGQSENRQLTGITESIISTSFSSRTETIVSDFTSEISYYIPVTLKRNFEQIPRMLYEPCDPIINFKTKDFYPQYSGITQPYFSGITNTGGTLITSFINCFVDLNMETDEQTASLAEFLNVSFEFWAISVAEGDQNIKVKISLDRPSINGFEEITVILIPYATNFGIDFTTSETYPASLAWAVGEKDKFLTFNINNDYEEELLEPFILSIVGLVNVNPGLYINTTVDILDRTNLNYVSIENTTFLMDNSGVLQMNAEENNDVDFVVKLDHPAFGVEKVTLNKVLILNTINGQVGPASIPLLPSEYILAYQSAPGSAITNITLPFTMSFLPGEINKSFLIFIKDNINIESEKTAYFELDAAQFCIIDQSKKMTELTVSDDDGKYKYTHINFGTIYNEFGNSLTNTLMRQINPLAQIGGYHNNIYVNSYSNYLIEYGSTITFLDYSDINNQSIKFNAPSIKLKITNTGTAQSKVNGITVNAGNYTVVVVPSNNYVLSLSTNSDLDPITNFFNKSNYKIELIDSYSAAANSNLNFSNFTPFTLRGINNLSQASNNTILIGNISLQGYNVSATDFSKAYKIKSKYRDINTGRIPINDLNGDTFLSCPVVGNFSNTVTYSQFYQNTLENVSLFGIMLLNYNPLVVYDDSNSLQSKYDGFYFVDYLQNFNLTCNKTYSIYNGLNYFNLPFIVETSTFVELNFLSSLSSPSASFLKLYNLQITNKGDVSVKITNTFNGPIKLESTGQIISVGNYVILQVDDTIIIPNQIDEPSFPGPGLNTTVNGISLLLPGNANYDAISHKYMQAIYYIRPSVTTPYSPASTSFNGPGPNENVPSFFDNPFTWTALESSYQKYKFVSQSDVSTYNGTGFSNGIHSVGNTGGNEDLIDVMLQSF